jgi:2-polyprenyl-3-methyl-5-hydroxy-6-metoxy-1,4-benzoquinol methylase/uncharacterized protein YbaR (Trm112 family)
MKPKLVALLACPNCGGELQLAAFRSEYDLNENKERVLDVEEGILSCNCGRVFPIVEGVPRLLEGAFSTQKEFLVRWSNELKECGALNEKALEAPSEEFSRFINPTLERFEKEWAEHRLEEKTWGFDQETRINQSLRYLGLTKDEIKGKLILDAGAGTGQLTCSMSLLGCEIVGIDLSPSVIRGWKSRAVYAKSKAANVHIIQGNLLQPPFRKEIFDGIMSQGVLHHTPDTKLAFDLLAQLVRKRGTMGVWLYKTTEGYLLPLIPFSRSNSTTLRSSTLRKITPKMPPSLLYSLLYIYATIFQGFYSLNALVRRRVHNQSIKERVTSLFDTLAPPYVWSHTPQEVSEWFKAKGYVEIRDTSIPNDPEGFCITGVRRA